MKNKKGFTLIELLMTVLIIAVLTAVAFPQYTKTLERSRATEAMSMVKSINDAVYAYTAGRSNGTCPESFRKLSITLPTNDDNVSSISLRNFRYELGRATNAKVPGTNCPGVTATRIDGGDYDYVIWNPYRVRTTESERSRLGCYSPSKHKKSQELCQSLGLFEESATPYPSRPGGGHVIDPGFGRPVFPGGDLVLDPEIPTLPIEREKGI